jgi:hypothetical protein
VSIEQWLQEELEKKYVEQYQKLHQETDYTKPNTYEIHVEHIKELVEKTKSLTLLDFGCGKASHYIRDKEHLKWGGIMPHLYDPAIKEYSYLPDKCFDGVICIDVLEHIPEILVEKTLKKIYSHARKFVYFVICTRQALWHLPNGENAHTTIKPGQWWYERINEVSNKDVNTVILTN